MMRKLSRRDMLAGTAVALGATALGAKVAEADASASAVSAAQDAAVTVPADPTKLQGLPTSPLGARSPFVKPV